MIARRLRARWWPRLKKCAGSAVMVAARVLTSGSGAKPNNRKWSAWDKPPSTWAEAGSRDHKHDKAGQLSRDYRPPASRVRRPDSSRDDRHGLASHGVLGEKVDPISWKLKAHALTPPSSPPSPPATDHDDERTRSLQPITGNRMEFGSHRLALDSGFSPGLHTISESEPDDCDGDGDGDRESLPGTAQRLSPSSTAGSRRAASRGSSRGSASSRSSARRRTDIWIRPPSRSSLASSRAPIPAPSARSDAGEAIGALDSGGRTEYGRTRPVSATEAVRRNVAPWVAKVSQWAADSESQPLGPLVPNHAPRIGPGYPGVHKPSLWSLPMASGDGRMPWHEGTIVPEVFPGMGRSRAYPWKKEQPRRGYTPLGRPEHRVPPRPPTPVSADVGVRRFKVSSFLASIILATVVSFGFDVIGFSSIYTHSL